MGFDIALALALGTTAVLTWLERQMVLIALVVTGVLLCCDAWFDLTLSWGTDDQWTSVFTALFIEVPIAMLMFRACHRLLRATVDAVRLARASSARTPAAGCPSPSSSTGASRPRRAANLAPIGTSI